MTPRDIKQKAYMIVDETDFDNHFPAYESLEPLDPPAVEVRPGGGFDIRMMCYLATPTIKPQ